MGSCGEPTSDASDFRPAQSTRPVPSADSSVGPATPRTALAIARRALLARSTGVIAFFVEAAIVRLVPLGLDDGRSFGRLVASAGWRVCSRLSPRNIPGSAFRAATTLLSPLMQNAHKRSKIGHFWHQGGCWRDGTRLQLPEVAAIARPANHAAFASGTAGVGKATILSDVRWPSCRRLRNHRSAVLSSRTSVSTC